jgi:sialate O-acetylesterase
VDGDLELLLAKDKDLRIVTVTNNASQHPQKEIDGKWSPAIGEELKEFSAVGYFFGRELRRALGVPVGLINNSWGGSAIEAWIPRDVLQSDERNLDYIKKFDQRVRDFKTGQAMLNYEEDLKGWREVSKQAKLVGKSAPRAPRKPTDPTFHQHRPANLWNGRVTPLLNYGIKGVIWYQGEANTWDRSYHYRHMLPMLIKTWRAKWNLGNFPFYWSQLADFGKKRDVDGFSPWAEIRESMTVAMQNPQNTGQAVITDLGEDADIHPRRKLEVAKRLVRWALAKDYGFNLVYSSPMYESHKVVGNKFVVTFDQVVKAYETKKVLGFTLAGKDQKFQIAQGRIKGNTIEVWCEGISQPVALRYGWAGNPIGNIISIQDLPLTPFRTDSWKLGSE